MDPYSSERWILESHAAMVHEAERRARLVPEAGCSAPINAWVAGRLRELADRLDRQGRLERAAQ